MARIAGVDIPNKHVNIALTYIYGIGRSSAMKICKEANVNPDTPINDLPSEELNRLREIIDKEYKVEGRLRSEIGLNVLSTSAVTEACATAKDFQFAVSVLAQIPELAKVRKRPLRTRRKHKAEVI